MMKKITLLSLICLNVLAMACTGKDQQTLSGLRPADFQREVNGQLTNLFVLKNSAGMEVCITNYGARVVSGADRVDNGDWHRSLAGLSERVDS